MRIIQISSEHRLSFAQKSLSSIKTGEEREKCHAWWIHLCWLCICFGKITKKSLFIVIRICLLDFHSAYSSYQQNKDKKKPSIIIVFTVATQSPENFHMKLSTISAARTLLFAWYQNIPWIILRNATQNRNLLSVTYFPKKIFEYKHFDFIRKSHDRFGSLIVIYRIIRTI